MQLKETLEVVDGTAAVFEDLRRQMAKNFYLLFVKSTDSAFSKKQNSFVLFKANLQKAHKDPKALFPLANCFFRLKNLAHDDLPRLALLSDLERDGDLLRLRELEQSEKVAALAQTLKSLEKVVDGGADEPGGGGSAQVEHWVEQSIAECVLKFRRSLCASDASVPKKAASFRAKFKGKQVHKTGQLGAFLLSLDRPGSGPGQKVYARDSVRPQDLDAHLLLFYRLLAIKYRLANPLSGGQPWRLSAQLEAVLDSRLVASGLKYLVLLRSLPKEAAAKKPLRQPRFK